MKQAELEEARRAQPMLSRRHAIEAEKEREREIERSKDMATKDKDKDSNKNLSKKTNKKGSKPKRKKSGGGGVNNPAMGGDGLLDDDELEMMLAGSDGGNYAGNDVNNRGISIGGGGVGAEEILRRNFQSALSLLSPQQSSSFGPGQGKGQGLAPAQGEGLAGSGHNSQPHPSRLPTNNTTNNSNLSDHNTTNTHPNGTTEGALYYPQFATRPHPVTTNASIQGPGSHTTTTGNNSYHHYGAPGR